MSIMRDKGANRSPGRSKAEQRYVDAALGRQSTPVEMDCPKCGGKLWSPPKKDGSRVIYTHRSGGVLHTCELPVWKPQRINVKIPGVTR
jgi:hypothetical protein